MKTRPPFRLQRPAACRRRALWLLLALTLTLLPLAAGAQRLRIYGHVRDVEGQPIELATVRVEGQAARTVTSLSGAYSLHCAPSDTLVVVYSMIGYQSRRRTFVGVRDSVRFDAVLPPYEGTQLGEAVVSALGVQTGTLQRITPTDPHLSPSASGNAIEELIATQAGVSTHNELSSQYNVRGGSFDENCVYINGIEVYRPFLIRSGQQEGLSIINPDMVESIGFSSGGFEARYGDRMSSVLDITYKRPERFEASVSGSLLGGSAYAGWGNRRVSVMASVRYKSTRHLLSTLDTDGEYRPNFLDAQAALSWRPNSRWSLDVLGNFSENHYNFAPADRETRFGTMTDARSFRVYFDGQEKDAFRTAFGSATLTRHFGPQTYVALQLSTFATRERESYDIQGQYWLNEATTQEQLGVGTYMEHARNRLNARVFDVGLRLRTRLGDHTLQAGLDWQRQHVEENSREWEMRDSMGYSLPYHPDRLELITSQRSANKLTASRISAYVQDTWRLRTRLGLLNVTYGLRFSHWDWNGETLLSPRASVGFIPSGSDAWTLRAAAGFYYQAPFYKELRDTVTRSGVSTVELNRDIRSQRSVHFVVGADYAFRMLGRPFRFTAEAYYKALSRLIPYEVTGVRVVYSGRNASSGYAAGIDFKLFGEFVPGADSWITFSLMRTRERVNGRWQPRPTDQRYNLSLHFTDYFPGTDRWRLTLRAALADGLPFGAPHTQSGERPFRAPAYKRVDAGLSYRLINNEDRHITGLGRAIKNAWLGIDAFNLLGISNVNSYYWVTDITSTQYAVPNYLTGRQINVRLTIDF